MPPLAFTVMVNRLLRHTAYTDILPDSGPMESFVPHPAVVALESVAQPTSSYPERDTAFDGADVYEYSPASTESV